jgi:CDGSH-type Zn-finger protein
MDKNLFKVQVGEKGPYILKGDVNMVFDDGTEEIKAGVVALCRCGKSSNKPYCDGTHTNIGFVR